MDITMTAVKRPEVIEKTLKSFTENLFTNPDEHRLLVNIDPVGDDVSFDEITNMIKGYFPNYIAYMPDEPSFPKAVIKIWKDVESEYFFHLEDDWILRRSLSLDSLLNPLKYNKDLACIRLYKHDIQNKISPILFGRCEYKYHSDYNYLTPIPGANNWVNQFGLNPVLIRKKFADDALPLLDINKDPEKQFRDYNPIMKNILKKWTFGVYGKPGDPQYVWGKNGLHWRLNSKYKKPRIGKGFTSWVLR